MLFSVIGHYSLILGLLIKFTPTPTIRNLFPDMEKRYTNNLNSNCKKFIGLEYAFLDPEFVNQRKVLKKHKSVIETITKHNMTDKNIMCMFQRKVKKIAVIMDEIDGMNQGDKGGLNALIKLIREKRTKKQRQEEITFNPIICIGNYHIDKKIKELMKVCNTIELKPPTFEQGKQILSSLIPNINNDTSDEITQFVQSDLRRMSHIYSIYENNNRKLTQEALHTIFQLKFYSEDTKNITKKLINTQATFEDHNKMMNETDRTIVGLLWHENIIDTLSKLPFNHSVRLYLKILKNICFADYIDRITFQKQIWIFNEMSSLVKTFYNNHLYHKKYGDKNIKKISPNHASKFYMHRQ